MQEIIPGLEKLWSGVAAQDHQVILCEDFDVKRDLIHFLEADIIVVTAFNASVAKVLTVTRETLSIDTPWLFYLHNQATIGLWPLYHWNMGELLRSSDQFISTCSRDAECFNQLFVDKKAVVIPFHYFPLALQEGEVGDYNIKSDDYVFVGRLSSQKNLHTLLISFGFLENQKSQLHFFGQEDGLGSPNMGTKDTKYLAELKALCENLNINSRVHFHGFVKREVIELILLQEKPIFISPSLHSDENFGMAAMRALHAGCRAVLSDWGGHYDFGKNYKNQVELVKVHIGPCGPFINPKELAEAMGKSTSVKTIVPQANANYKLENIQALAQKLISSLSKNDCSKLKKTLLLEETLKRVTMFHNPPTGKIFESYEDKLAHSYFKAYGAKESLVDETSGHLLPWVKKVDSQYKISDPHRGNFSLKSEIELKKSGYIY